MLFPKGREGFRQSPKGLCHQNIMSDVCAMCKVGALDGQSLARHSHEMRIIPRIALTVVSYSLYRQALAHYTLRVRVSYTRSPYRIIYNHAYFTTVYMLSCTGRASPRRHMRRCGTSGAAAPCPSSPLSSRCALSALCSMLLQFIYSAPPPLPHPHSPAPRRSTSLHSLQHLSALSAAPLCTLQLGRSPHANSRGTSRGSSRGRIPHPHMLMGLWAEGRV